MKLGEEHEIKIQSLSRFYILLLLKSKSVVNGYQIIKRLEKDLGTTASPTGIYNFLKDLKAKKYIEDINKSDTEKGKGLKLTPIGDSFIDTIFTRFDNLIEAAVQSKIKVCASCGIKLYEDFYQEDKQYFCCEHCAKAYKNSLSSA
jgi:DNA-binding PadR family transcriptional regulator